MSQKEKHRLEKRMEWAYGKIRRSLPPLEWLSSDAYKTFIAAWEALLDIYIDYDTFTEINVEIVAIYLQLSGHLRKILADNPDDAAIQDAAEYALDTVNSLLDELIKEGQRNLYVIEDLDDSEM